MSLICCACFNVTVMSEHPDHYHCCHKCDSSNLTDEQKNMIEESNKNFGKNNG